MFFFSFFVIVFFVVIIDFWPFFTFKYLYICCCLLSKELMSKYMYLKNVFPIFYFCKYIFGKWGVYPVRALCPGFTLHIYKSIGPAWEITFYVIWGFITLHSWYITICLSFWNYFYPHLNFKIIEIVTFNASLLLYLEHITGI